MIDIAFPGLKSVLHALQTREISSIELVDKILERIEDLNPSLHALSDVITESARAAALDSDLRLGNDRPARVLEGVPVVIKEIIDTTPAVCSAGLSFLSQYRPKKDAPVVKKLRSAGAVIVGVSTTDPGAFGVRTPDVIHPQAPEFNVGGSSGGSGAALAAGFCFAALGSDTGGSIRIPSACCLVSGFKPTYGRVSTEGVRPLAWSLDHIGPLVLRVEDTAVVQRVIDPEFEQTARGFRPKSLTVGYAPAYYQDASIEVKAGIEHTLDACRSVGVRLQEISLPDPDEVLAFHMINLPTEAAAYHFETFPGRLEEYPVVARETLEMASRQFGYQYVQAQRKRHEVNRRMVRLFEEIDFILVPTLPILPPRRDVEKVKVGDIERNILSTMIRYTCLFDQTGQPAFSLPVSILQPGVGVSVQVVGPHNRDGDVIAFAELLEKALSLKIDYSTQLFKKDGA